MFVQSTILLIASLFSISALADTSTCLNVDGPALPARFIVQNSCDEAKKAIIQIQPGGNVQLCVAAHGSAEYPVSGLNSIQLVSETPNC